MPGLNGNGNHGSNGNGNGAPPVPPPPPPPPPQPKPERAGGATATYLTAELIEGLRQVLVVVPKRNVALKKLGVNHRTFYRWLARGKVDLEEGTASLHADLAAMLDEVRPAWISARVEEVLDAAGVKEHTNTTVTLKPMVVKGELVKDPDTNAPVMVREEKTSVKVFPGDWRASAWLLERLENATFGRKDKLDLKGRMDLVGLLTAMREDDAIPDDRTVVEDASCPPADRA